MTRLGKVALCFRCFSFIYSNKSVCYFRCRQLSGNKQLPSSSACKISTPSSGRFNIIKLCTVLTFIKNMQVPYLSKSVRKLSHLSS